MLNLKTVKMNVGRLVAVGALLALIALVFGVGAVAAHAQSACFQVPIHSADWYYTPFGGYWGACMHFMPRCY
jgi:hypothetical protein